MRKVSAAGRQLLVVDDLPLGIGAVTGSPVHRLAWKRNENHALRDFGENNSSCSLTWQNYPQMLHFRLPKPVAMRTLPDYTAREAA